jgi:cobalt-zinc-cadmium efflux system membrane fusion protein
MNPVRLAELRFSRHRTLRAGLALALLLGVAPVYAHGGEDHSHADAPAASVGVSGKPSRLPDGGVFVPKAAQQQWGLRTVRAKLADLPASMEFNGTVIADPNAGGRVQASQSGRIEPGPNGLPSLGQHVVRGQVLAQLRPTVNSLERGAQQAALADTGAQLALAEARLKRYAQLEGAIPGKEIESARIEFAALKQRQAALGGALGDSEALVAPVSGVIAEAHAVAGQVVEARDVLFEIVDPARMAIEALAYDPAQALDIVDARLALNGASLPLRFVGAGRQLRAQALPMLFRVDAGKAVLAVGQPVKVIARGRAKTHGAAVPVAALSGGAAGASTVWVKLAPERYAPRRVTTRPLDGAYVVVTSGLAEGERVVSVGASLLAEVR